MAEPLRLRVQLTKRGRMRFLSHTEYSRTLMLAARRSGLPLYFSGDYRPHVKVSLSPPLPIGITSECELIDFFMEGYVSAAEAELALTRVLPDGLAVVRCRLLGHDAKPVGKLIDSARYSATLPADANAEGAWGEAVEVFLSKRVVEFERVQPRRTRVLDLRPGVHQLALVPAAQDKTAWLDMIVDDGVHGTVKPREVLRVIAGYAGAPDSAWQAAAIQREGLFVRRGDRFVSPMELGKRKPAI